MNVTDVITWHFHLPPLMYGEYLIATPPPDGKIWIAYYKNGKWVDDEGWEPDVYAWAHLPELPKNP